MSKVLIKAYLPTLDEKRGVSLDDIESLRWIPSRRKKTFSKPVSVSRSTGLGVGANIPWEQDAYDKGGTPLPGLFDPNNPGQINPNVDVSGTWVGPSNIGTLLDPDFTFNPQKDQATLLGITETPHWFRGMDEGAKTRAGEGFQYGGFDKDAFVEIPLPKSAHPQSISNVAFNMVAPPFYQRDLGKDAEETADFISQFPQTQGTGDWERKVGAPLNLQQLIDQGHLMPLSENQKILDSPFIKNGEPMDIAMRLLKISLVDDDETDPTDPTRLRYHIDPDEQLWGDEADIDLRERTTDMMRYLQDMSPEEKLKVVEAQGDPMLNSVLEGEIGACKRGVCNHEQGDALHEKNIKDADQFLLEAMMHSWMPDAGNAMSGLEYEPTPNTPKTPYWTADEGFRAHAVDPSQWRKLASEPMDIAMRLLKMPVVDTKVPGLKVAHGFDEPVRELHNYNPSAGYGKKWQAGPELIGATNFQTDEMEEMTPNEYFDRLAEVGINTFTGQKKFPVPHEKTLLGQSQEIQDQFADSEHRTLESMRHQNMKFPPGEGPRMVDRIVEGIKQGKVMGAPEIDMTGDTPTGYQEGGHRMDALRLMGYGDTPIPVAITRQTDIQTGEPMNIAMRLLKEELSRVQSSPTVTRQKRTIVANQNPANLPCPMCDGRILQQPCQKCGRPASLGAGTLKSDISKNLNRWFKEKWVDVSRKNKDGKHPPCGRSKAKKSSKGYPKCRPSVKVSSKTPKTSGSMSQGQKQAATKRKRAKKQGVGGKPTIVKSFVKVI